jgi:hypothetical protein
MNYTRILNTGFVATSLVILLATNSYAQVPDYDLQRTQSEKDSLTAVDYPYIFPLFGEDLVRKGFQLPLPVGINIVYYQHSMDVVVDRVSLGLSESQLMPLGFVEFDNVINKARTVNVRVDLWLLPFLNIYGMVGYAESDAKVILSAPFAFETTTEFDGWDYGGGAVVAFGLQSFWVTANGNLAWTDMKDYKSPIRATVLSFRLGRTLHFMKDRDFQIWLGAMYQDPQSEVAGQFLLADVVTADLAGQFEDYYLTSWYNAMTPEEQQFVDAFVQTMMQGSADTRLDYEVVQNPEQVWNMIAGAQLELSKRWSLEAEAGFLGSRTSFMMNVNYRLPL